MLKKITSLLLVLSLFTVPSQAADASSYHNQKSSTYKDIYDQNIHGELVNQLDLGRWKRKLFGQPSPSANVNIFDEIPDSAFFTNRHARTALSQDQLLKGYSENEGPDLSQDLVVVGGEIVGLSPDYFVKDSRGDEYLLKFDSAENFELATSAEIISSRFYHALGYNVPQYTISTFSAGKLKAGTGAKFRDDTGFLKPLTQERIDEYLLFAPQNQDGSYRVSTSKILKGESKGAFSFTGRRKADPSDIVNHRDLREIRALTIFSAWLNNTDVSETNTLDMLVTENNKKILKHYLIDFNSSLGSAHRGAKPPMFGYEYLADFGEAAKAFFTLGFWEKPWQKRWREAGEKVDDAAVGYFNNNEFRPNQYKTQLPYEAFKRLTRADGFWAAKQMIAFRDEDIRTLVSAGKLTSTASVEHLSKILIERRDLIAKYWFSASSPLDDFKIESGKLVFKDLAVQAGFEKPETRSYRVALIDAKGKTVRQFAVNQPEVALDSAWFQNNSALTVEIRTSEKAAAVYIKLTPNDLLSVRHQD